MVRDKYLIVGNARIGEPLPVKFDTAAAAAGAAATQSGGGFDWNKALNSLLTAGLNYATAVAQANALKNSYSASAAAGQYWNPYAAGPVAQRTDISTMLPYLAAGAVVLILLLRK